METISLTSPAKLNLFLHINGQLPNGYHELQSVFVPVGLSDTIHLKKTSDGKIRRVTDLPFDAESDLMVKAAKSLQAYYDVSLGVDISITKNIPMGAGLGGGSSNAATVLRGLSQLWALDASDEVLHELAIKLGADVPFFLQDSPAIVEGIGEKITPISLPSEWCYMIVCPHAHIATATIFNDPALPKNARKYTHEEIVKRLNHYQSHRSVVSLFGENMLEEVALKHCPALNEWMEKAYFSTGSSLRLTGSGSALFLVFDDIGQAKKAMDDFCLQLDAGVDKVVLCQSHRPHIKEK
ncbi:4-(cytidine 5'-diphospho)-2-C-methyl-D-erythritol kinase [Basilea psittacipulmonis]|uniref:4-diphosphocytidyl-2-C-methyl-D-erythritol kinase n=1 Tax=Basilea psittacipulmonis DSM 24701 TaxID=1072685 RepID=A0A077DG74_9BURK|nr:4-(cytidine 5'-diphospho)-2-C-methyl-D-erythritol kinase [Basilea psittacipulmonis]AIL32472.1 hypothetical protein IX83_03365 [Basilea psittacipulmonis DSM 24701]